ncbi:MAG: heavy metal-associated domain-containing protein [Gemmatimonadota bacterium]
MTTLGRPMFATLFALAVGFALMPPAVYAQEQEAASQREEAAEDQPRLIQITVLGMSCPFCAYGVERKLKKLDGVSNLTVELETGLATLVMEADADVSNEELRKTVEDAGFEAAKITRNFESQYPAFTSSERT